MAVSVTTSGSQLAVIGTEHTLTTLITAGVYHLAVNLSNMVNGDELELNVFVTVGGSSVRLWQASFCQNPDPAGTGVGIKVALSPPVISPTQTIFTLTQTAGTGRTFAWEVWQY